MFWGHKVSGNGKKHRYSEFSSGPDMPLSLPFTDLAGFVRIFESMFKVALAVSFASVLRSRTVNSLKRI